MLSNNKGSAIIAALLLFCGILAILQMAIAMGQLAQNRSALSASAQETRLQLVHFLDVTLSEEMALRNSRYSINDQLKQCLTGQPTPCDERIAYDMVFVSPTPPMVFQGGTWPAMPAGVPLLAGGLNSNKVFHTPTGGRCPFANLAKVIESCPLQSIIQFKPVCGGTMAAPELSVPGGGVCTGGAKGFDITVGVGRLLGYDLVYRQKTEPGGDAAVYRFNADILKN